MKILFFDTETTGVPARYNAPCTDTDNWPRLVQLGWILSDGQGNVLEQGDLIVRPDGFVIPEEVSKIHGITQEIAMEKGIELAQVISQFQNSLAKADIVAGHNVPFDIHIVGAEFFRLGELFALKRIECMKALDTMKSSTNLCKIQGAYGYKWPKLIELHQFLFGCSFESAHNAMADIEATKKCFFELVNRGVMTAQID